MASDKSYTITLNNNRTEKEAIDGALALIDKGTVKANFKIERVGTSPNDVQVVVVDRNRVLARSDVFSAGSSGVSDESLDHVRSEFIDSSGLITDLRSLKRTRNFREITSRGTVDATELVNVKPVITESVEKVLPGFIKELAAIDKGVFDYEIDAAVDADSMADLPESAISTIKVNAGITNLNWTEVIDEDGESTTKLIEQ